MHHLCAMLYFVHLKASIKELLFLPHHFNSVAFFFPFVIRQQSNDNAIPHRDL